MQQYKNLLVLGTDTGQLSSAGVDVQWDGTSQLLSSVGVAFPFGRMDGNTQRERQHFDALLVETAQVILGQTFNVNRHWATDRERAARGGASSPGSARAAAEGRQRAKTSF
ncbi:hypothetical protein [Paraburkholderia sp. J76]|uniref:hypothetical protein n=1 Tax=Paraburkholderia sp. J76 TaxID=2805439 RepID=UPI002ABDBDA8|nr:hypothetical protein [Paraburkholderia sp. J76]